jgi:hypothetical protein
LVLEGPAPISDKHLALTDLSELSEEKRPKLAGGYCSGSERLCPEAWPGPSSIFQQWQGEVFRGENMRKI